MEQTPKAFTLRLPADLYEPIAALAVQERRSLQGQVLHLLDQALEALEDAQDIRAAEVAKADDPDGLPLAQARAEIERERAALRHAS